MRTAHRSRRSITPRSAFAGFRLIPADVGLHSALGRRNATAPHPIPSPILGTPTRTWPATTRRHRQCGRRLAGGCHGGWLGTGAPGAHLGPEPPQVTRQRSLPGRGLAADRGPAQEGVLPTAECLAQLHPVGPLTLGRIGTELEQEAVLAMRSRQRGRGCADGPCRVERGPVSGETRRQVVPVGTLEPCGTVAWSWTTLGEVQQQKHVGDQLLDRKSVV